MVALPKALTELRLFDENHLEVDDKTDYDCVHGYTKTRKVECLSPDYRQLGQNDRIAHDTEQTVGDQSAWSV